MEKYCGRRTNKSGWLGDFGGTIKIYYYFYREIIKNKKWSRTGEKNRKDANFIRKSLSKINL